jgi:predicted CxxxxCH...CXXCH cytochrome family protein
VGKDHPLGWAHLVGALVAYLLFAGCHKISSDAPDLQGGCRSCHGSLASAAPPMAVDGASDTSAVGVGAHQVHVLGGALKRPVACQECHVVPKELNDPGHIDHPLPAYVIWGDLAKSSGADPAWDHDGATCKNTYCHGATLGGGSLTAPKWTIVDGSQAKCGTCHGLPPPAPHPQSQICEDCHAPVAGPGQTLADPLRHADGKLDVKDTSECNSCHGSAMTNSAPPHDTSGKIETSLVTVGAHQTHLAGGQLSKPVACEECHIKVTELSTPGHIDHPPPAAITWGPTAKGDMTNVAPAWDHQAASCANTYCHGATLGGGTLTVPTWTIVDGTQAACGTCHGLPPPSPHPNNDRCETCHLPTAGPNKTIANRATHIDGTLQVASSCGDCHGTKGGSAAPPVDVDGKSDTSLITVGAHQSHLTGGRISKAVACDECHIRVTAVDTPGHVDHPRPANVVFGDMSKAKSHAPSFTTSTAQCGDTYCHNGPGAMIASPTWNKVDGTQSACGSCHGLPPPAPHPQDAVDCSNCHVPTAGPNKTIANPATHVDGILQVTDAACNTCHGDMTSPAPPKSTTNQTAPTDPAVGAHRVHLAGGQVSAPVACNTCHVVPVHVDDPGHKDHPLPAWLIFGGMSSANGATPTFDPMTGKCSDTYCHGGGNANSGGTNVTPTWNVPGSVACGSCHALPPNAPHPQVDKCEICHADAGPNHTIADRTRHLNGVVDVDDIVPCERCHGSATNAAPPSDLMGSATGPSVGAHQAHLRGTGRSLAVPCSECHIPVNPATPNQAGHYDHPLPATMTWGPLASKNTTPSMTSLTCANYCHGATLPSGTMTSVRWGAGGLGCDACHGMPPRDQTHGNGTATNCIGCHPDTAGPNQTIAHPDKHVNGVVETSQGCDTCHGSGGNPAPPNDTLGRATGPKVGVHREHLTPTIGALAVPCTDCHVPVTSYTSPGHVDHPYPANVIFGGISKNGGTVPMYDYTTETCNTTYCHGATMPGGKTSVVWSDTTGADAQCAGCHGMPPPDAAHTGQTPTSCNTCHVDVAGPNGTIAAPALHVDGIVEVNGGGCTACHASPPTPAMQNYPGGGGAHLAHTAFNCDVCHGDNGSGPNHNQGNGNVLKQNVNIVFQASLPFPGGTTMSNGQAPSYDSSTQTCLVGCHNPIVNNPTDPPSLTNRVTWQAGPAACASCHANVATASPRNHDVGAGDAGCKTCHSTTGHTSGAALFNDPNPSDTYAYAPGDIDGLCKTCHDGWAGTAFPSAAAPNESTYWTSSAHGAHGIKCTECHAYHSAANRGPLFFDRGSTSCQAAGCHANLTATFQLTGGGLRSHHPIEGGTGIKLSCNDCHNPHLAQPTPLAAVDPGNKTVVFSIPTTAVTTKTRTYNAFCERCHGPTPPALVSGAKDISTELAGGTVVSQFKIGSSSQHRSNHSGYGCQNCHDKHGSAGSTGINRGASLPTYLDIRAFPYTGQGSCSTPIGAPYTFSCH